MAAYSSGLAERSQKAYTMPMTNIAKMRYGPTLKTSEFAA